MNQELKSQVNNSPLKKKFIAQKIGVHPGTLSMCLKGERHLDADKEEKLKEVLKSVST